MMSNSSHIIEKKGESLNTMQHNYVSSLLHCFTERIQ